MIMQANSDHGTFVAVDTSLSTTNLLSENFIGIARNGVASGKGAFIDTQGTITNSLTRINSRAKLLRSNRWHTRYNSC